MDHALVIGGTRFIGRHLVEELLEHEYEVTLFNRGNHENPFADTDGVDHVQGDRTDDGDLVEAAAVEPDAVFDCVAYFPRDVRQATTVFDDVDAYVYISSGAAYGREDLPKREGFTPLCECTDEQATADESETYGPRKAEGDRVVFEAAADGVNAMSVRPPIVYGPHDYTERLDYWIDRIHRFDRVVLPGDGTNLWHRVYVEDVASGMRIVAEEGEPGEAYNVGDQRAVTLRGMLELIDESLAAVDPDHEAGVELVTAGARELAAADLALEDFVLYRDPPHMLTTGKVAQLGWESTPLSEAMERTVDDHLASDRTGRENGPDRADEERVLGVLDTLAG
ncbi:NAD-dependent epimerase/dehydratase [Halovivax asiaticus JCM 14624]|uniref:NAD-dependent epimerase/dehydratase n=1 Tax=Halovivax asiaticus JCM 14624 TaxID=1227490 RepID=M0BS48_9EURY|nr:NAD-dependent epimerase/dehydratase family protein [Halovivax asiaticus]ELZ13770.1 NAD-dependent epimerase/dehydratase [Halovivax asiaticus JCM 14624]